MFLIGSPKWCSCRPLHCHKEFCWVQESGKEGRRQMGSRNSSVYGLTLSEVEDQLGEPLHTMNLDELLRNVLPNSTTPTNRPLVIDLESSSVRPAGKTVNEVWRDIQDKRSSANEERLLVGATTQHSALREMTLEDFLVKAGVVTVGAGDCATMFPAAPVVGSLLGAQANPAWGKRVAPTPPREVKMVERRQKRMIKNRESAARSRARKQAYTNELEIKISQLEEENEMLRKQKELDQMMMVTPFPEPKHRLRRTNSNTF